MLCRVVEFPFFLMFLFIVFHLQDRNLARVVTTSELYLLFSIVFFFRLREVCIHFLSHNWNCFAEYLEERKIEMITGNWSYTLAPTKIHTSLLLSENKVWTKKLFQVLVNNNFGRRTTIQDVQLMNFKA